MNKNAQAILIYCCDLCANDNIKPLMPSEWKKIAAQLMNVHLEPFNLLNLSKEELVTSLNTTNDFADRLIQLSKRSASLFFEIAEYEKIGIHVITRADKKYPKKIKQKLGSKCPPFFFYAGDLDLLNRQCVGFVGSRFLDNEDVVFETNLVKKIVHSGYSIVSGGAKGADMIAEKEALLNGGSMIEFVPDSMLDKTRRKETLRAIQNKKLLLVSAVRPDARFYVGNAMACNRFIHTQSDAIVAIKSINKGGTWNGVIENLKHKYCPVFCWNNQKYADNLELIEKGAFGIDEFWDLNEIRTVNIAKDDGLKQLSLL